MWAGPGGKGTVVNAYVEKREYDQFFFSEECLKKLVGVVSNFNNPCALCVPTLGYELEKQGKQCRTLDIDARFSWLKGFKYYDMHLPTDFNEEYDLLLCDPPFKLDVQQIFEAVNKLKREGTTIIVSWYQSRLDQFLQAFSVLHIKPVGVTLSYRDNDICFYNESEARKFGKVSVELYSNNPERIKQLWDQGSK
jgi:hypothetical protein